MGEIQQILADNLRIYRKWKGLSQEKLGELCGLHRTYIGGIEQQITNVSIANVEKIAQALQIDPALLFIQASDGLINAAKKRGRSAKIAIDNLGFKPGGCALCTWKDDDVIIEPLPAANDNLTVDILVALMHQGHIDDLAESFKQVHQQLLDLTVMAHALKPEYKEMKKSSDSQRDSPELTCNLSTKSNKSRLQ